MKHRAPVTSSASREEKMELKMTVSFSFWFPYQRTMLKFECEGWTGIIRIIFVEPFKKTFINFKYAVGLL